MVTVDPTGGESTTVTFTARLLSALKSNFNANDITRVLTAVERMHAKEFVRNVIDETHPMMVQEANSYLEGIPPDVSLTPHHQTTPHHHHTTRYQQQRISHLPHSTPHVSHVCALLGVRQTCFFDTSTEAFRSWVASLESKHTVIRDEFLGVIQDSAKLAEGSNVWVGPLAGDDVAQAYGNRWKTFGLYDRAEWDEANVRLFPKTSSIIHKAGVPIVEVLFARMAPNSEIKVCAEAFVCQLMKFACVTCAVLYCTTLTVPTWLCLHVHPSGAL